MSGDTARNEHVPAPGRAWARWGQHGAAVLCAVLLLWTWSVAWKLWMAFGPRPFCFLWLAGTAVCLALLVALEGRPTAKWRLTGLAVVALAWTLASATMWYTMASPLSREPSMAAGYAASTWWLLWAWLMFRVSWRWPARLGVWIVLLGIYGVFLASAKADGWDGDALPRVVWRFRPADDRSQVVVAVPSPNASSAIADEQLADYPRFRGDDGLGTVHGAHLARDWSGRKPKLRWRHGVGAGWSSLAVAGDLIVTQEQRGDDECVAAYDRSTGRERWAHADKAHYRNSGAGDGPRATPTVDGQSVYSLGATGILNALDRDSGQALWSVDILKDNDALAPVHGMTGSPLVVGDLVVVSAGGAADASLVAYDNADGHRRWRAGKDPAGYTSPMLVSLAGVPQILIVNAKTLCAHEPHTGSALWSIPWENGTATNCSQPYPIGDKRLFVSSDYGKGCALVEIEAADGLLGPRSLWTSRGMQTKFCSAVVFADCAFGLDDGILECVSLADGRRRWKHGRYGHGQMLLADNLLVIQAEDGRVVLVEASPEGHRELSEFPALEGKTWNHPALAGRQLFVRNDREAACYELPMDVE